MARTTRLVSRIQKVVRKFGVSFLRCNASIAHLLVSNRHPVFAILCFNMVRSPESSSPFAGPDSGSITTGSIIRSGHLPSPALGIILEIDKAIKALSRTTVIREKICEYIQRAVRSQAFPSALVDKTHNVHLTSRITSNQ